jgi:hypothetical protein
MSSRQKLSITELKELEDCSEATLLDSLAISKTTLAGIRKETLSEPLDWLVYDKQTHYSRAGIRKLLVALALLVEVSPGNVYPATITKLPVNPNMLLAQLEDKTDIKVRVRSQLNFTIGMKIKVMARFGTPLFDYKEEYPRIKGHLARKSAE